MVFYRHLDRYQLKEQFAFLVASLERKGYSEATDSMILQRHYVTSSMSPDKLDALEGEPRL